MLVELSVVEQRYHLVMEVPRWAYRWSWVIPPHTPYGSPAEGMIAATLEHWACAANRDGL